MKMMLSVFGLILTLHAHARFDGCKDQFVRFIKDRHFDMNETTNVDSSTVFLRVIPHLVPLDPLSPDKDEVVVTYTATNNRTGGTRKVAAFAGCSSRRPEIIDANDDSLITKEDVELVTETIPEN